MLRIYQLFFLYLLFSNSVGIMLKKECHPDEVHKSCIFTEEYTCWETQGRMVRVKKIPQRLPHCLSGCFCRKGMVREFPRGQCILANKCRDRMLVEIFKNLPVDFREDS